MACQEIINRSISRGETVIPELDAQKICAAFRIPYVETMMAQDKEQCLDAAQRMGYPVVIKIVSKQITHKSDVGGVVIGIGGAKQLASAYDSLWETVKKNDPTAVITGVLVQKQAPKGIEVAVGGLRNEHFGPVVMFGLGGIYIEVFKDVSFRLAPLDKDEALRQIKETRAYPLLQGARGQARCDIGALCDLIVNTAQLISTHPEIQELDFNPVFCYPDGCTSVDARIVLKNGRRSKYKGR